jgi:hypothetical protein
MRLHLMGKTTGVLTQPSQQTHALNIVRTWDPNVATIMVLLPVALSLSVSVIWSVVVLVQASTQTGFTIGGYVVTAGTFLIYPCLSRKLYNYLFFLIDSLLIALVAPLHTKVNAGERSVIYCHLS